MDRLLGTIDLAIIRSLNAYEEPDLDMASFFIKLKNIISIEKYFGKHLLRSINTGPWPEVLEPQEVFDKLYEIRGFEAMLYYSLNDKDITGFINDMAHKQNKILTLDNFFNS